MKSEDCKHKNLGKEYVLGTQTGDWYCPDCDTTFSEKPKQKKSSTT